MKKKSFLKVRRLEALTDGIFAITMTILVLELRLPFDVTDSNLWLNLKMIITGKLFIYAGSFIILGTQWIGITVQHGFLEHINRPYIWANIFYLMTICLVPFSVNIVGNFLYEPIAISFYAFNLIFASIGWLLTWQCAYYYRLNGVNHSIEIHQAVLRRILITPLFYFVSLILAHWNTMIAFLILIAPPLFHMIVLEKTLKSK